MMASEMELVKVVEREKEAGIGWHQGVLVLRAGDGRNDQLFVETIQQQLSDCVLSYSLDTELAFQCQESRLNYQVVFKDAPASTVVHHSLLMR